MPRLDPTDTIARLVHEALDEDEDVLGPGGLLELMSRLALEISLSTDDRSPGGTRHRRREE